MKNLITRETVRYNELKKLKPGITSIVLSDTSLELEHKGLISKELYHDIPPRVEYKLTDSTREHVWAQRWKFSRIDTRTMPLWLQESKCEQRSGHSDGARP